MIIQYITSRLHYYIDFWNNYNVINVTDMEIKKIEIKEIGILDLDKCEKTYLHFVTDHIKEKILRNLSNLKKVDISIQIYDDNDKIHKFIFSIVEQYINLDQRQNKYHLIVIIKENQEMIGVGIV